MSYADWIAEEVEAERRWLSAQPQAQTTAQPVISTASTTVLDDEDPWADEEPGQINIDRWMEARG